MGVTRAQKSRKQTYEQIIQQILFAGYDKKFYMDQVDEYMRYYDNLQTLNDKLSDEKLDPRSYIEILKEKRQVTKEMRSILSFLNLQPTSDIVTLGDDEDEIL